MCVCKCVGNVKKSSWWLLFCIWPEGGMAEIKSLLIAKTFYYDVDNHPVAKHCIKQTKTLLPLLIVQIFKKLLYSLSIVNHLKWKTLFSFCLFNLKPWSTIVTVWKREGSILVNWIIKIFVSLLFLFIHTQNQKTITSWYSDSIRWSMQADWTLSWKCLLSNTCCYESNESSFSNVPLNIAEQFFGLF